MIPNSYESRASLIFLTLLLGSGITPRLCAQQPDTPVEAEADAPTETEADTPAEAEGVSLEQLQVQLESLRRELQREQAALKSNEALHESTLSELREQRQSLAERLLSAQLEIDDNANRLKSLRDAADVATADAEVATDQATAVLPAFGEAVDQIRVQLREVPGSKVAIDDLRQSYESLEWSADEDPDEHSGALTKLLAVFDQVQARASRLTARRVEIFTASGRREEVKLLALGHVRFAYQCVLDDRIGLALASPRDVEGYRWSEALTPVQQETVRGAIAAFEANQPALIEMPLDPVGRIGPEALNPRTGLLDRFRRGGLVMYPLAGLALVALLLIFIRAVRLYPGNRFSEAAVGRVLDACRRGEFEQASKLCNQGRGAVSRVLQACLNRRSLGQRAMEDSIQEQLLHELPKLQRLMGGIATLAAVAPLLGLLGTVTGIIRTFGVIRAFGNANPSLMAGGISEALMTTATGLMIAVPILIVHSVLQGRAGRIMTDAERFAANLLTTVVHTPARTASDDAVNDAAGNGSGEARSDELPPQQEQEATVD